jgi:hypothetical protein
MNIKNMHPVDQLGHIKAQIADLEEQQKAARDLVIAMGQEEVEGDLFRATVSTAAREGRDKVFKDKIEELVAAHLSHQFISAHTMSTDVVSVRVAARKGIKLQVKED